VADRDAADQSPLVHYVRDIAEPLFGPAALDGLPSRLADYFGRAPHQGQYSAGLEQGIRFLLAGCERRQLPSSARFALFVAGSDAIHCELLSGDVARGSPEFLLTVVAALCGGKVGESAGTQGALEGIAGCVLRMQRKPKPAMAALRDLTRDALSVHWRDYLAPALYAHLAVCVAAGSAPAISGELRGVCLPAAGEGEEGLRGRVFLRQLWTQHRAVLADRARSCDFLWHHYAMPLQQALIQTEWERLFRWIEPVSAGGADPASSLACEPDGPSITEALAAGATTWPAAVTLEGLVRDVLELQKSPGASGPDT
jgi:hypothetical protein